MKKLILASSILAAFAGTVAHAEEAAPAPDHVVAYNVGVATDYRYRGISQSRTSPALSLGADYTNTPTGFYVGAWASTIRWIKDSGGSGAAEVDIYAGKRGEITKDLGYDIGILQYYYPSNSGLVVNANTTELYGQVGMGPAYLKYSHSFTNTFGNADSKNSYYLDAGANIPLTDGLVLNLHAGHQHLTGAANTSGSYTDYKIGVTKDFGIATAALAVIGTDADKSFYNFGSKGYLGNTAAVLTITKSF